MANHKKPTKEELRKSAEEAARKAEKMGDDPKPSASPTPSPTPSATPSASPTPSTSPTPSPSATPSHSISASASPSPSQEDELTKTKKKAAASAREAQVLHSRTKKYDDAVAEAEKVETPTDEVMEAKYGKDEWQEMTPGQQQLAKETWVTNRRFEIMSSASKEGRDIQEWNEKVDKFINDPKTLNKYSVLEGKQEDFKLFAIKPTRRGLDFEDLVLAFAGELATNPPKKNKGAMFEKGGGGDKGKKEVNDGKISAAQGRILMQTNYKKYKELLKAGKIRNE